MINNCSTCNFWVLRDPSPGKRDGGQWLQELGRMISSSCSLEHMVRTTSSQLPTHQTGEANMAGRTGCSVCNQLSTMLHLPHLPRQPWWQERPSSGRQLQAWSRRNVLLHPELSACRRKSVPKRMRTADDTALLYSPGQHKERKTSATFLLRWSPLSSSSHA